MNELCLLTSMSSSDVASWAQACVGALAMLVGTGAVFWQVRRGRMELSERESRAHDGLARMLTHLKNCAAQARIEKRSVERLLVGNPAEPSAQFKELADAVHRYPLEAIHAEVPLEALLTARRVAREMWPLLEPTPEIDIDQDKERAFQRCVGVLEEQISLLRGEAKRLLNGERARHAAAAPNG